MIRSALSIVALLAVTLSVRAAEKPNVILIMADDLGYETIGCYGGTSYKTPVLDQMAATGVRFSRCHVQPLCTPTRVQLMTGQYNVRNYVEFGWMDPRRKTFGNYFKDAGYATCIAGKWQLGRDATIMGDCTGSPASVSWCLGECRRGMHLLERQVSPGAASPVGDSGCGLRGARTRQVYEARYPNL